MTYFSSIKMILWLLAPAWEIQLNCVPEQFIMLLFEPGYYDSLFELFVRIISKISLTCYRLVYVSEKLVSEQSIIAFEIALLRNECFPLLLSIFFISGNTNNDSWDLCTFWNSSKIIPHYFSLEKFL